MSGGLWLSGLAALALLHTYWFYPTYLRVRERHLPPDQSPPYPAVYPTVSVLVAAYNEEAIIVEKLRTVLASTYPSERLHLYVGSDRSTDRTNALLHELAADEPRLQVFPFTERRGKPGVINELAARALARHPAAPDHIFLLTDANVLLEPDTLRNLVRHFAAEPALALVDSHLVHTRPGSGGVGGSERAYIGREVRIKYREGRLWRRMIGPFGGCYALRSNYFRPVPPDSLVDDFYLAMQVFVRGGGARNDLAAYSYEAVGERLDEEFRRKARISTGNVQNLRTFRRLWWPPTTPLGFAFFSHKILRWLGPLWLLLLYGGAAWAAGGGNMPGVYLFTGINVLLVGLPLLDWGLHHLGLPAGPLRTWRYFVLMNVALGLGWWRYLTAEQRGIWEPPRREEGGGSR